MDEPSVLPSFKVRRLHVVQASLVFVAKVAVAGAEFWEAMADLTGNQLNYEIDKQFAAEARADIDAMTDPQE